MRFVRVQKLMRMWFETKEIGDLPALIRARLSVRSVGEEVKEDFDRLTAVGEKYGRQSPTKSGERPDGMDFWRRYFRAGQNLQTELFRIYKLGLNDSPPLEILDVGAAAGVFVYMCKHYGHDAMGSDVCRLEKEAGRAMAEQAEALRVRVVQWAVTPMVPAPDFGKRFDLITGFQIKFDQMGDEQKTPWGVDEWRFFLSDLRQNLLTENGRIFISGVRQCVRGSSYDPEVVEFFRSCGAHVGKGTLKFSAPPRLSEGRETSPVAGLSVGA